MIVTFHARFIISVHAANTPRLLPLLMQHIAIATLVTLSSLYIFIITLLNTANNLTYFLGCQCRMLAGLQNCIIIFSLYLFCLML